MRLRDFLQIVKRRPFRAFRITVSTGETFDVVHPETVFVADRFVAVPLTRTRGEEARPDDYVWIDFLHIVHLQPRRSPRR